MTPRAINLSVRREKADAAAGQSERNAPNRQAIFLPPAKLGESLRNDA